MTPTLEAFLEAMGMELAPIPPEFQKHLNEHFLELVETSNAAAQVSEQEAMMCETNPGMASGKLSQPASAAPLPAEAVSELCL